MYRKITGKISEMAGVMSIWLIVHWPRPGR